jgi:hypothetical protein
MTKIPSIPYATLDSIADNDFLNPSDTGKETSKDERNVLRWIMYNHRRNPFVETRMQYFGRSIRHYTSRDTINNAIDYVKTYFRK